MSHTEIVPGSAALAHTVVPTHLQGGVHNRLTGIGSRRLLSGQCR